jgi:methylmalonyl-CoA mutase cobalamin-binding domain/chain
MLNDLADHIVKLDRDKSYALVREVLEAGENPIAIIDVAKQGMEIVGERFNKGEFYLAELMLSGKIFQTLMGMIDPYLSQNASLEQNGKILLATPSGDIHDLGKNIVATMFKANGWEVIDLGVNVPVDQIVAKTVELKPNVLGLSCLLTTAFDSLKQVADSLTKAGFRNKIKLVIGGGVTNESTRAHIGADFQCTDVMDGLAYCREIIGDK